MQTIGRECLATIDPNLARRVDHNKDQDVW
jgi:hypothetical protein